MKEVSEVEDKSELIWELEKELYDLIYDRLQAKEGIDYDMQVTSFTEAIKALKQLY